MRFSTLLGYFINNEIIMMLIVGKNHRARFQISGGLLCSVVHRIVIDVFFQASYNAQGCQNFQKKNIYVKKNPRKKGVYLLTVFIFACHFALSLPFFSFLFLFFQLFAKKEWHLHCLHQHYQSVGNHEYSLVFFILNHHSDL